mmetsp:Transcript_47031/g.119975  ORF Transcript_47031/g.119975 Transcript_47031/m.119975 type:complete len:237 (+) Transcript_47031:159-869(+)
MNVLVLTTALPPEEIPASMIIDIGAPIGDLSSRAVSVTAVTPCFASSISASFERRAARAAASSASEIALAAIAATCAGTLRSAPSGIRGQPFGGRRSRRSSSAYFLVKPASLKRPPACANRRCATSLDSVGCSSRRLLALRLGQCSCSQPRISVAVEPLPPLRAMMAATVASSSRSRASSTSTPPSTDRLAAKGSTEKGQASLEERGEGVLSREERALLALYSFLASEPSMKWPLP